jgi:hypothetical protein
MSEWTDAPRPDLTAADWAAMLGRANKLPPVWEIADFADMLNPDGKRFASIADCRRISEMLVKFAAARTDLPLALDALARQQEAKDAAYLERNRLVALLSKLWPSHLAQHPADDLAWSRDWLTIVCIHAPFGQITWHLHDAHVPLFAHLTMGESHWDGHTTEEKYQRIADAELASLDEQQEANARLREQIEITRAAMEANLALPLHEHATDVTRLITESAYGNGTLSIVGVWDIASLTPDKLEQLRARGEREFVYAHAFDALLTNQPEWTEAFGGLTVNDIAQHVKMQTAELIEERYQRSRAEAENARLTAEVARMAMTQSFERDGTCVYCGQETSCIAGNPAKWPMRFPEPDGTGILRIHHTGCVLSRLAALADRDATIARLQHEVSDYRRIAEAALTPAKEADRG